MKTLSTKFMILTFTSILIIAGCSRREVNTSTAQSFDSVVSIHLRAITTANLEALDPTVGDSVTMISPFGHRTTTKTQFMDLHRYWFSQTNWEYKHTILEKKHSDSLGYALLQYRYTEKDSIGNARSDDNYLVLVFRNSNEGWKLVHDQNTRIPKQ
jgi:ketosteroid isomerase-like protein